MVRRYSEGAQLSILITGAASGIGAATARRLSRNMRVIVADIDVSKAKKVVSEIAEFGGNAHAVELDVTDGNAVVEVVEREAHIEPISSLFCNAGINIRKRLTELSLAEWQTVFSVHVKGAFLCAKAVIPLMAARRSGSVLIMSSDYAIMGMPAAPAYAAAKTALYSLTKSLALEFASFGVRVNALGPGPIDTPLLRGGRSGAEWNLAEQRLIAGIPLGRLGLADEVAATAEFLLSERAAYITGQILHPNGGQTTW